jgi:hypothetical protein
MVTAGKANVYSAWFSTFEKRGEEMEAKRYIGIDLHRDCFTACVRLENGREYLKKWKLEDMPTFADKLRPTDEVAVEMTATPGCSTTRLPRWSTGSWR